MLTFLRKNKKKNFLRNNDNKHIQAKPDLLNIPSIGWRQVNELISEMPILDCLEAILNRIDNLNYFSLNNNGNDRKSFAFSRRHNKKWYCTDEKCRSFESHSIKEVIEHVENGGDKPLLPVLIKR